MHCRIYSATTIGINAHLVEVEVDLSFGMLQFFIVGLPDRAINESRQRIQTAIKNSGIRLPERKITVNLAPADLKKEGTLFDLPILVAIVQAAQQIAVAPEFLQETIFLGELSLDGSIRSVKGVLPLACSAKNLGKKRLVLPEENVGEAAIIEGIEVIGVNHVTQLIAFLRGESSIAPAPPRTLAYSNNLGSLDFDQVHGQYQAKRALQISAAGRHNVLFLGSPGSGKTMLAKRLPTIMPPLTFDEIVETSKIYSVCGKLDGKSLMQERPFRSPHHTISQAGLVGGGTMPQPGEISLAHQGILFLDELTEFKRSTLEVLRQPLESKNVCIARANQTISFPASFLLVAALNPCPCGYLGDPKKECFCNKHQINRYLEKISGPLLDRIDLQLHIQSIDYATLKAKDEKPKSSAQLYEAVERASARQKHRFGTNAMTNATMTSDMIATYCVLSADAEQCLKAAFDRLCLSMRGYHKILKVARTIADLEDSDILQIQHIQEAIMYRSLDQVLEKLRT
jgi:magnesium chelatase family protein